MHYPSLQRVHFGPKPDPSRPPVRLAPISPRGSTITVAHPKYLPTETHFGSPRPRQIRVISANAGSLEWVHDMVVPSPDAWLPPPTTIQDSASHNNRYHSPVHVSHPQPVPHHSPPTPSTSHSSPIFSLAMDASEDDNLEESKWEERDSYAADVPRQPYHMRYWCGRLPGPAPLAEDLLEQDAARANHGC